MFPTWRRRSEEKEMPVDIRKKTVPAFSVRWKKGAAFGNQIGKYLCRGTGVTPKMGYTVPFYLSFRPL